MPYSKDKYHFDIVKSYVVNGGSIDAFSKIALVFDLSEQQINTLIEILEDFENKDFKYDEFDADLEQKLKINYQGTKIIFEELYKEGRFIPVIQKYIQTNYNRFGNVSHEYHYIANQLAKAGYLKI